MKLPRLFWLKWCFRCDRHTLREHRHSEDELRQVLNDEWRTT